MSGRVGVFTWVRCEDKIWISIFLLPFNKSISIVRFSFTAATQVVFKLEHIWILGFLVWVFKIFSVVGAFFLIGVFFWL